MDERLNLRTATVMFLWSMVGFLLLLTGCGTDASTDESPDNAPGKTDLGYSSITEREFAQPDEFYDYGDFDRVKVIHLNAGTCVLYQVGDGDGAGTGSIACDFNNDNVVGPVGGVE